jgi:hypothetical protein
MKIIGWILVLIGACACVWAVGVLVGKLPGLGASWWPLALLGVIAFVAGWACMRLSRRQ